MNDGQAARVHKANLAILISCQLISATGSIAIVTLGGIIGVRLSGDPAWATLPVSLMVVAVAATTVPATMLMRRIGRSAGFALASLTAMCAVLIAAWSLHLESFSLFLAAAMLFGINMAFTQQYRYAAAESVPTAMVARAVSFVLLGSIGGAFIGPLLVTKASSWASDTPYAGTMFALAGLYLLQAVLLLRLREPQTEVARDSVTAAHSLRSLVTQPVFVVAVLGGTAGYGLMTLLMTATPLSMHVNDGFSLQETASVIRAHVLAMYVPSLFSGFLIERFGVVKLMLGGVLLFAVASLFAMQGQALMHYWWTLVLVGAGWNFLYVGGTTMLTYTYTLSDRFRAQAVNEFLVFGSSAVASLAAGLILHYSGWHRLVLVPLPLLLVIAAGLLLVRRDTLLPARQKVGGREAPVAASSTADSPD